MGSVESLAELARVCLAAGGGLQRHATAASSLRVSHDSRVFAGWAATFSLRVLREGDVLSASLLDAALEEHLRRLVCSHRRRRWNLRGLRGRCCPRRGGCWMRFESVERACGSGPWEVRRSYGAQGLRSPRE